MEKYILDACCGGRMMWFDKEHPNVVYVDNRLREKGFKENRPNKEVKPDIVADNKNLPFPDSYFRMVVMDMPHLFGKGEFFNMVKDYGWLNKDTWYKDIRDAVNESWRVLDDLGVFIFKWNEASVKRKDILSAIGKTPLFGHPILSKIATHWFCFMKNK